MSVLSNVMEVKDIPAYESLETFCETLELPLNAEPAAARKDPTFPRPLNSDFTGEKLLANFDEVARQCGALRYCIENAEDLREPFWRCLIHILAYCKDGREHAHQLSMPHPGYDPDETDRKLQAAVDFGKPLTCDFIAGQGPELCQGCEHRSRVKTPYSLGIPRKLRKSPVSEEIADLNKEYAVVVNGSKTLVLWEHLNAEGKQTRTFLSVSDFRNKLANRVMVRIVDGKSRQSPLAKEWLESPDRREYDGVVFDPSGRCGPSHYNTYRGLAFTEEQGDWSLLKEHMLQDFCRGDKEHFRYLMALLARMVQDPGGDKPGIVIVLRGKQGVGKGIVADTVGSFFGPHYSYLNNQQQLVGKFNQHLEDVLLLFVDEGFFAGDKQGESTLKGIITERYIRIEPKGRESYLARNFVNIIMASNSNWVVPAGMEERRYFVLDVSDAHMQNHAYFRAIVEQLDNGGREAMLYDLLNFDYSDINLREVPKTSGLFDQKVESFDPVTRFWFGVLVEGRILYRSSPFEIVDEVPFDRSVTGRELYEAYLSFCQDQRIIYRMGQPQFTTALKKLLPILKEVRVLSPGGANRGHVFPSLDVCREHFANLVSADIDWERWSFNDWGEPADLPMGSDVTTQFVVA